MATFRSVNTALAQESRIRMGEEPNPATPRPSTAPHIQPQPARDDATTPTRANFGSLATQKPLPATSFPSDMIVPESYHNSPGDKPLGRGNSQHSTKSRDSEDVDMEESDEGEDGSDDESVNADGTRSSKKKKSQRFYCTDYPPCNLSFTRSEHLARHIRKHTGERPFQCHCSRRFSRLDNLRQHAQTVHQNEDIPQDSLAATGTRFQRQVRTDRVRPPGSRSRASTAGSSSGSIRGHQRNSLSASSITSVGSGYSTSSDIRRRPPPLVMAGGDLRNRYSQEIYRPDSPSSQYYRPHSPGGFSTPTSATFSTGQNSPRWGSGMQSPISSHSRTASLYGSRTPGRRLSVPSSGNPFQSPHGNSYGPPVLSQLNAANAGSFSPSSGMVGSPTSTTGSSWSRRESITSASDEAWRRRTWHPETYSNFTSRLQNVTTPNYYSNGPLPQPPVVPSNAPPVQQPVQQSSMRLPGIESFDPLPPRPTTPVRRQPSPMVIDTPSRPPPPQEPYQNERPHSQHWDMGINRNLTRLDIAQGHSDTASSWASEAINAVQAQAEHARIQPAVRFEESPYSARVQGERSFHQHTISAPPITPKSSKRQGWYSGPLQSPPRGGVAQQPIQRTSTADSSSSEGIPGTPRSNVAEIHPAILRSNGWVEHRNGNDTVASHQPQAAYAYPSQQSAEAAYMYPPRTHHEPMQQPAQGNNMSKLEALVAVATANSGDNGTIHI